MTNRSLKMAIFVLILATWNIALFTDSYRLEANSSISLGNYMGINILPAGTFELRDPQGRRLYHQPGKEDINEIPGAFCGDLAYAVDDTMKNEIYIFPLIEGCYRLKILADSRRELFFSYSFG